MPYELICLMHDQSPTFRDMLPVGPVEGTIRPPGSKSITNRALLIAALADGDSCLRGALDSEDTRIMLDALRQLGVAIHLHDEMHPDEIRVSGCRGRFPRTTADLFVGNSGTTMRFLAAALSTQHGRYRIDGIARMRERPMGSLLEALQQLGVQAQGQDRGLFPPITLNTTGWQQSRVTIAGDVSSQFLSGLLMAAPCAGRAITIELAPGKPLVSAPYVRMTLAMMRQFGAEVQEAPNAFIVSADHRYCGREYTIEPDASAASYFWAAAAITGGRVTVQGLSRNSLQGDVDFCECLQEMGCGVEYAEDSIAVAGPPDGQLTGIDVDMNAFSDTVPTLAVVALAANTPTRIRNVAHIRHKETDRIGDLACELRKLGATVDEYPDGLAIKPGPPQAAEIRTYNDHRMAMAFAIAGLRFSGVRILDPGCTAKTYPKFFEDLEKLTRRENR